MQGQPMTYTQDQLGMLQQIGMSPEQIEQMSILGVSPEMILQNVRQQREAQTFMQPQAQGMNTGATYVAANPMSHIADMVRNYRGGKELGRLREQHGGIMGDVRKGSQAGALAALSSILRGGGRQQGATPPTPAPNMTYNGSI